MPAIEDGGVGLLDSDGDDQQEHSRRGAERDPDAIKTKQKKCVNREILCLKTLQRPWRPYRAQAAALGGRRSTLDPSEERSSVQRQQEPDPGPGSRWRWWEEGGSTVMRAPYLEERFSKKLRLAGSILYCILMIFYLATVLYGPAVALYTVASLPHSAVDYIQAAVGLVCILYTSLGGMRAILWVDTFQTLTIIIGLVITLILGTEHQEGFGKVWEKTGNSSKIKFFDYNPDPEVEYTIWSMLIGGSILYSAIYSTNQAQVQTACTSSTLSKAQIAVWLTFPGLLLIISLCCLIGVVMSAFYITRGDPKEIFNLTKSDQYLPYFVMEVDKKYLSGFQGLFWGCIFSGTMSSVSSGLNSMTAVILREFNVCCLPEGSPNRRAMLISRILGTHTVKSSPPTRSSSYAPATHRFPVSSCDIRGNVRYPRCRL